jgi:ligand-binding sensor domain-containing protein
MGTRGGGITRYDGTNFKTYTVKDGLINNYVFCIKEDAAHNLWIGTNNGLSMYNGVSFRNFYPAGDSAQVWVQDIDFDKQGRKVLATNIGVLLYDDPKAINLTTLAHQKMEIVNDVLVDRNDNIWYGTGKNLFKLIQAPGSYTAQKYGKDLGFMNNAINCLSLDAAGNIWIGTAGDGAYVYDGKKFFRIDPGLELYKKTVLDIYFDNRNNVWLATLSNGVCQYNILSKTFTWLGENEGLSNNHVRSITQDNSGNYWFGTSGGGVCNYFGKQFTHYDKYSGLGGNFIYSIFRDSKQRLWIGTSDRGLSLLDSSRFKNYNSSNGFLDVKVKSINEDDSGNIYFGTDGQGVFVYNGTDFRQVEGLDKKFVRAIVKDKNGSLWIATAGTGLYKLTPSVNGAQLENLTINNGLLHNRLTCLHYDKQGRLWYGTENNGIGIVVNGKVQKRFFSMKDGLPSNTIRCFTEDQNGYLWLGTAGSGLACFPLYQGDFPIRSFDYKNGLTSSNIYLLTCDAKNNIFAGSETGLDYLGLDKSRKLVEVKHYSKGEGFIGIETCQNAVYNDADGSIWFGTINGLSRYDPANQVKNEHEPVTSITDVRLFYEPIVKTAYKDFAGDWNSFSDMSLPYDQNHLTFDFFGINFSNPDAVRYSWKLEGFDKEWSPVSAQRTVTYSNLGAGDYTFLVKASNEDNVWNKVPVSLKFHIHPPFWLRWWFILLVSVAAILLILAIFRWRVSRIKAKAAEAQQKIQLEKEVLELEQKALRLQMNPHFIFNALNSIQSQIGTDNEQAARYYLAKFSRLMRQILDNSKNALITLEEEVNTLENYLLIEKFCNGDRFDYSIEVDESIEKDYVKIPPMLLQPFVENAIKHGLKFTDQKRGFIRVRFSEKKDVLECSVTDNGIGRVKAEELNKKSKETYHQSTALAVTQERLELLKINPSIQSLQIIDLYDEQKNATGTEVIVRIPLSL